MVEHRPVFSIRAMCRGLSLHTSGFYVWVKNPLSHRAQDDERQTKLLVKAWNERGNIYGYHKLHDDLCDLGETCCPNRVAQLASDLYGSCCYNIKTRTFRFTGCLWRDTFKRRTARPMAMFWNQPSHLQHGSDSPRNHHAS